MEFVSVPLCLSDVVLAVTVGAGPTPTVGETVLGIAVGGVPTPTPTAGLGDGTTHLGIVGVPVGRHWMLDGVCRGRGGVDRALTPIPALLAPRK